MKQSTGPRSQRPNPNTVYLALFLLILGHGSQRMD
jgi:hypothetical protein